MSALASRDVAGESAQEIAQLRRDLTSARVRNRTLIRALTRAASAPTVAGVVPGPTADWDETIILTNGVRFEHRLTAGGWCYIQAESVPTTLAAIVDEVFAKDEVDPCPKGDPDCETGDDGSCHDACESPSAEMAVIAPDEDEIIPRGVLT